MADASFHVTLLRMGSAAMGAWGRATRVLEGPAQALLLLTLRLWVAQAFFVSGVVKVADWDNALYLAAHEYPVSWLDPASAAVLGVAIELGASLLLAAGLATRTAAAAMLVLALVIQTSYVGLDVHLLWMAVLGWLVVFGGGACSLDRLLARGLARSPLPLAATVVALLARVTRVGGPVYVLLLRVWLAAAILLAALRAGAGLHAWLPLESAAAYAGVAGLVIPLALGVAARPVALAFVIVGLGQGMLGEAVDATGWVLACALLLTHGADRLSLDALIGRATAAWFALQDARRARTEGLPRVVIVGAGFGGVACAAVLARARVAVTLIDRHNYHLFQPLLYQVATASLSPGDIATPVRALFREHANVRVLLGQVTGVDTRRQKVLMGDTRLAYDFLVLATGASHSYFGRDEWAAHAPGLKRIEDATEMRCRLLAAFEQAEATEDAAERAALLTFVVVGGGPTGVELAGAIAELARYGMEKDFRRFDPASARIILVQAGPRLLPSFSESLSTATREALERLGVEVRLNSRVESIDGRGARVNGMLLPARTVLWAAGVVASPAARWLGASADTAGRVKVEADLSVTGLANVFAVGDTALAHAWKGAPVPGLAPAAKQGGAYVARVIRARLEGRAAPGPFVYRHLGSLATVGRKAAVADFGKLRFAGALAWWFWGVIHVAFLVGLRNRVSVMFDWLWAYLTFSGSTRLITGAPPSPRGGPAGLSTADIEAEAARV